MTSHPQSAAVRTLLAERFGRPPLAELRRPLTETLGTGGPDTPEAVAERRRVLTQMNSEEEATDGGQ